MKNSANPSALTKPATVLVVDDEKNIRLLVRTTLEVEGHKVFEAPDGGIALEAIRTGRFDLVILDLNMPVLDGLGVLKELQDGSIKHPPRVIVLTAYGSISAAVRATRRGALDFLEKPVTPEELRGTVRDVLREPQVAVVAPADGQASGYAGVLERVRKAVRASDVTTAEGLLMQASDLGQQDAAYFNLLGVIYELRGQYRLATKMYGKSAGADRTYVPAQQNLKRQYELNTFGRTAIPAALGDGQDALEALRAKRH